jgi:hypothetical protein
MFEVVKNETKETVAAITLDQFGQVCDQVDSELAGAMSGVFAQRRTMLKAAAYAGILCRDDVPVKTCWDMAEAAGYEQPRPFQSLMSVNDWDSGLLWDVVARLASEYLACPEDDPLGPGIAVDETAQPKRGRHTAGAGVQYAGFAGGMVNCVTSVMLSLVTPSASAWVGSGQFLQEKEWFSGQDGTGKARRQEAGVPEDLEFQSKPGIARRKLALLRASGMTFTWSAADEVYGRSSELRKDHEDNGEAYAYFVPRDFRVELPCGERVRADGLLGLAGGSFEVRACGNGLNGPRLYAWAMIATASPEHFLVIRRAVDENGSILAGEGDERDADDDPGAGDPGAVKLPPGAGFMYCHVPERSPIAPTFTNLLLMIGRRWPAEETTAVGKGPAGWDHNQFRKYGSIQRHTALTGLAMLRAILIRQRAEQAAGSSGAADSSPGGIPEQTASDAGGPSPPLRLLADDEEPDECMIPLGDAAVPHRADEECPQDIGCIRLSVAETIRLISIVRSQASAAWKQARLRWSAWRRRHQAIARWHHRRARLAAAASKTTPSEVTLRYRT